VVFTTKVGVLGLLAQNDGLGGPTVSYFPRFGDFVGVPRAVCGSLVCRSVI